MLVCRRGPLKRQRLFETMNRRRKVTQFDEYLCLLHIDVGNSLLEEEHFVELDQSSLQIILVETLFSVIELFENMFFFDFGKVVISVHVTCYAF